MVSGKVRTTRPGIDAENRIVPKAGQELREKSLGPDGNLVGVKFGDALEMFPP